MESSGFLLAYWQPRKLWWADRLYGTILPDPFNSLLIPPTNAFLEVSLKHTFLGRKAGSTLHERSPINPRCENNEIITENRGEIGNKERAFSDIGVKSIDIYFQRMQVMKNIVTKSMAKKSLNSKELKTIQGGFAMRVRHAEWWMHIY